MPVAGNLECTRLALESLLANTDAPAYEVLVVNNGSREKVRQYLDVLAARNRHLHVIHNDRNLGFAAACDQGVDHAQGDRLIVLSNDTVVPPDWLRGLETHLEDPAIGLVVPTTNCAGGNAQVPAGYGTYEEMQAFARRRKRDHDGDAPTDFDRLEIFCAALRRDVWNEVGGFDAGLEVGQFEEDFENQVRASGHRVVCADELFVHRFGGGFVKAVAIESEKEAQENRIEAAIKRQLPDGSRVVVVSGDDDAVGDFEGYEVWRFPELDGDDAEAIAQLDELREQGVDYLVIPATETSWLESREGFRRHLDRFALRSDDPDTAVICDLAQSADARVQKGRGS